MLEALLKRMDEWRRLGCRVAADGSRIIGHVPRDYPQAYLHRFFAPRSEAEWQSYGFRLPPQLLKLYAECNGLSIFSDALCIYGIRSHYQRDDSAQFQPFDLLTHNEERKGQWYRASGSPAYGKLFFGAYGQDGSGICIEADLPQVYRVPREEAKLLNQWPDIRTFLESEYEGINKLFTPEGYLRQKGMATAPDPERKK